MRPTISVILTTYNAKERLRLTLESYRRQSYPTNLFELVIVDDGSQDGTEAWFKTKEWSFSANYVYNVPNKGRAGARNEGVCAATGEVLLFTDGDMLVEPDFIERHAEYHQNSDDRVVCGSFWQSLYSVLYRDFDKKLLQWLKNLVKKDPQLKKRYAAAREKLKKRACAPLMKVKEIDGIRHSPLLADNSRISKYFAPYTANEFYFVWLFFVVMNVSVRKKHLERVGGFDENLVGYGCEDTEIGYRLWRKGLDFIVDPTLQNYHQEHARNFHKLEKERTSNMLYMVKKHKTVEMALYNCVPVGNTLAKSTFMFNRGRLLSARLVSKAFVAQVDQLIWRCAIRKCPELKEPAPVLAAFDEELFWREAANVRSKQEFASFVFFVEQLYAKSGISHGL